MATSGLSSEVAPFEDYEFMRCKVTKMQSFSDVSIKIYFANYFPTTIHPKRLFQQKNLHLLATETCKSKTGVSPKLMNAIFHSVERPYNLRSNYIRKKM